MTSTTALLVTSTFCRHPGFSISGGGINTKIQRPACVLRPLRCAEHRIILVGKAGCSHFDLQRRLVTQSMSSSKITSVGCCTVSRDVEREREREQLKQRIQQEWGNRTLSHPLQVSEVIVEFGSFSPAHLFTHHLERRRQR